MTLKACIKHTANMCAKHLIDGCKIRELFFRHHNALVSANGMVSQCYCI